MWHATWKQGNWGDFWLLVVGSQIGNLTPDFSFGHNLCFKYPNGSCQPILDIYVPRVSNDIRNFLIQWVLTLVITLWRFESPLGFQFLKWGIIWECGGSFPHTLLHSQEHEVWFPCSLLACAFVNPCLGPEPKARVAIMRVGMVAIPPMWWPLDQFWQLHHVEFDVKFIFFQKINEITSKLGWNTSYLVATTWFYFPTCWVWCQI
jgi:hypothetical protein